MKQVYLLTYPTGKIYIGKDSIGSSRYMGSPDPSLVNADFATLSDEMRRNYTIRKLRFNEQVQRHLLSMI